MAASPRAHRLSLGGLAAAGVVAGHAITYLLSIRDPVHRAEHLAQAGHRYWSTAVWVAGALAVWSLLRTVVSAARSPLMIRRGRTTSAWIRLAAMQVPGFVGLEALERAASGVAPVDLFHHELLWVGLLVQVLLAGAGALLVRWLARAGELVGRLLAVPHYTAPLRLHPPHAEPWIAAPLRQGAWGVRGPPAIAA